jgi:hypothetical protein
MQDPFLREHHIGHHRFLLAGRIHPVSIRDQVVRAELFVERAHRLGLFKATHGPFVVIGAGAAGVAAACRAAMTYQVETILIEKERQPFHVQAKCQRWVSPTHYDFPAAHYSSGNYPIFPRPAHRPPPFTWSEGRADLLALQWRQRLRALLKLPIPLTLLRNSHATLTSSSPPTVQIHNGRTGQHVRNFSAGLVLIAAGFGKERRFLDEQHDYWGWEFWRTDDLELPLPQGVARKYVISGSGDGGIQDFLRVATGRPMSTILPTVGTVLDQIRSYFVDLESEASRSIHWNFKPSQDHDILMRLDAQYDDHIQGLLTRFPRLLKPFLDLLQKPLPSIQLLIDCDHLGLCYPLNRLLAKLFRQAMISSGADDPFRLKHAIIDIASGDPQHQCQKDPVDCFGKSHTVRCSTRSTCTSKPAVVDKSYDCSVLVIRHGAVVDFAKGLECFVRSRQILPFDV